MGKPPNETNPTKGPGKGGKAVKGYKGTGPKGKAAAKGKDIKGKGKYVEGKGKAIKGDGKDTEFEDKGKGGNTTPGELGPAAAGVGGKDAGKAKGKKGTKGTEVEDEAPPKTTPPAVEGKGQSGKNKGTKGAKGKTGKKGDGKGTAEVKVKHHPRQQDLKGRVLVRPKERTKQKDLNTPKTHKAREDHLSRHLKVWMMENDLQRLPEEVRVM